MGRKKGGDNFLTEVEDIPWSTEEDSSDLVALSGREFDTLTGWAAENLVPWLFNAKVHRKVRSYCCEYKMTTSTADHRLSDPHQAKKS